MYHCTLLCVGSIKKSWIQEGCQDYLSRLPGDVRLEVVELTPSKQSDADKQRAEESDKILTALQKREGLVIVLDERGKSLPSIMFSDLLSGATDEGTAITFVIGGAYGLSDAVRKRADFLMQLSDMTLPHELCRIFFLEQLYRAFQIRKGTGYHHP